MKTIFLSCALLLFGLGLNAQNIAQENAVGCWNMQKSVNLTKSGEKLQLNHDGSFAFVDYNAQISDYEKLSGTWEQIGDQVNLLYDDRPKQTFLLKKDKKGKWMLVKDGGFELMRSDPSDCQ